MHEILLYSGLTPCPYLDDRVAQMPLRRPIGLTAQLFDERLAQGDRRLGRLLYRTACPGCQACEAIRVPVAEFRAVRTHARTLKRGDALPVEIEQAIAQHHERLDGSGYPKGLRGDEIGVWGRTGPTP